VITENLKGAITLKQSYKGQTVFGFKLPVKIKEGEEIKNSLRKIELKRMFGDSEKLNLNTK